MRTVRALFVAMFLVSPVLGQTPKDPFPKPIPAADGAISVNFVEFATIPDIAGEAPRVMIIVDEPGTKRLFVDTMRGPLYSVSYDGKTVTQYLDVNAPEWGVNIEFRGREARHPKHRVPSAVQPGRVPAASASSTPTPTRPTWRRSPTSSRRAKDTRTTLCSSSGPRKIPQPPPTTAARPARCSGR